jgi:membrane-bound lytic murein transglycosylase D
MLFLFVAGPGAARAQESFSVDDLMQSAEEWMNENLDDSVLESLKEVDRDQVRAFLADLQRQFTNTSVYDMAGLKTNAARLAPLLSQVPETQPYAAWLQTHMDYFDASEEMRRESGGAMTNPPSSVALPPPSPQVRKNVWTRQLEKRPLPAFAKDYVPVLKPIFRAERVPEELVWLAEVESTFDPSAKSPAGAAGLFQLMRPTAKTYGLSTWLPDERLNPRKSARAAAAHLRHLHERFGDWRLALAAYNAGEGCVDRLLKKSRTRSFDAISGRLPAETQMYVPKLEATLSKREGVSLSSLKPTKSER